MTIGILCCDSGGVPPEALLDRFAPTILVGNELAGDTAPTYSQDGFNYILDPGDGSGIAAALALFGAQGGRLYIRRGLYDLGGAGSPATPLVVPANVAVQGEGRTATSIRAKATGDQGVFSFGAFCSMMDIGVGNAVADPTGVGSTAVVRVTSRMHISNVQISCVPSATGALKQGIRCEGGTTVMQDVAISGGAKLGAVTPSIGLRTTTAAIVQATGLTINGFDIGVDADRSTVMVSSSRITDWDAIGVRHTNSTAAAGGGSLTMADTDVVSDGTASATGIYLGGYEAHRLTSVHVRSATATRMLYALRAQEDFDSSYVLATNCVFVGQTGIKLGDLAADSVPSRCAIIGCSIDGSVYGMDILGGYWNTIDDCFIRAASIGGSVVLAAVLWRSYSTFDQENALSDNSIQVFALTDVPPAVQIDCREVNIDNNRVLVTRGAVGIDVYGTDCMVSDNRVTVATTVVTTSPGIRIRSTATGTSTSGNKVFDKHTPAQTAPTPMILVEAPTAPVLGNTTTLPTGSSYGIRLAATTASCNVCNNSCFGSATAGTNGVDDLGVGNNVSNNLATA